MFKKLYIFIILFIVCSFTSIEAATLHALLVGDTHANNIGSAVTKNLKNVEEYLDEVINHTELKLNKVVLSGDQATQISSHLNKFCIGSDDVVFLYMNAHGYRLESADFSQNPWPSIGFNDNSWLAYEFEDVSRYFEQEEPRLLIGIVDTCNVAIPDHCAPPHVIAVAQKGEDDNSPEFNYSNMSFLFEESRGVVMAASACPGQFSYSEDNGSVFTIFFLASLEIMATSDGPILALGWEDFPFVVTCLIAEYGMLQQQVPYFEVRIFLLYYG